MSWPWWAGLIIASPWIVVGLGSLAALLLGKAGPDISEWQPPAPGESPSVSVVVPARNEEHNLERCLRSLLASDYPEFEVVVVNDRSTDGTLAVARRVAGKDERITVVDGAEKPADWAGKPWACWQGYTEAVGDLVLFTDADTEHGPALLGRTVGLLRAEKADLVSVMPHQEMKTFWERMVQPFFFLLLGLRYGSPARMNRNRNPRDAIANGQFILVTRDSYQWVGGHKKVRASIIEDLQLAAEYTLAGRVLRFAIADRDMKTRMYRSLDDLLEGWSKNAYVGMMHTMKTPLMTSLAMISTILLQAFFFLGPIAAVVVGAALVGAAPAGAALVAAPVLLVAGIAAYLGCAILIGAMLRAGRQNPLWALLFPLGALIQLRIFGRALLRGTRRIEWKGRTYDQTTKRPIA